MRPTLIDVHPYTIPAAWSANATPLNPVNLAEGLKAQILDAGSLSSIFGIDIADSDDEGIREMPRSGPKAGGSSSRPDKDSKKAGRPAKRSVAGSRRQTKSGLKTAMTRQAKSPPRKLKRRPLINVK